MALTSPSLGAGATSHSASTIVCDAVEGSDVLKIQGHSKGLGKCIKSATFDVAGHGWYIEYYPDAYGSTDPGWISFHVCLQYSRATDVKPRITICLLDEMGVPVPSYTKEGTIIRSFNSISIDSKPEWRFKKFIQTKALEESSYLKDDCFSVRCDITVSKEFRTQSTKRFVTVPPPDMHQHIGRLLSAASQVEADVTFQVGAETVNAHRVVLAARSPVFMAELFGPMKENGTSHIKIEEMDAAVFKAMLYFIYNDSFPDIDKEEAVQMAQHLLVAADRYDIQRLKLMCEDKLCNSIGTRTVTTYLALAEQHGCSGLKEACFEFLKLPGDLKAILSSDDMQQLTSGYPSLPMELVAKLAP